MRTTTGAQWKSLARASRGRTIAFPRRRARLTKPQKNQVRRIVRANMETKSHDVPILVTNIDATAGVVADLTTGLVRGTSETTFIGGKINPVKLDIRFNLIGGDTTNMVRVILMQNLGNAGVPVAANILQSVANVRAPLSAFERDFDSTYRVIVDRMYQLDNFGDDLQKVGRIRVFGKNLRKIHFDAAAAVESHGLHLFFISDSLIGNGVNMQAYSRLYFKDA